MALHPCDENWTLDPVVCIDRKTSGFVGRMEVDEVTGAVVCPRAGGWT
jgi:hypothetical protein